MSSSKNILLLSLFSALFFFLLPLPSLAQEDNLILDQTLTVWTKEDSPHIVPQALLINKEAKLIIEPGAVVKLGDSHVLYPWDNGILKIGNHQIFGGEIFVDGELVAQGTPEEPIIFTSYRDDSVLGDTNGDGPSSGTHGDWGGICISGRIDTHSPYLYYDPKQDPSDDTPISGRVILNYTEIRHTGRRGSAIKLGSSFSQLYLGHSFIHNNNVNTFSNAPSARGELPWIKVEKNNFYDNRWPINSRFNPYYAFFFYVPSDYGCGLAKNFCNLFSENTINLKNNWWEDERGPLWITEPTPETMDQWMSAIKDTQQLIFLQSRDNDLIQTIRSKIDLDPFFTAQYDPKSEPFQPFTLDDFPALPVLSNQTDPLLMQYLPILYFHPEEDFYPINVEDFTASSSLWRTDGLNPDILIKAESKNLPISMNDLTPANRDTTNYYLQFSEDLLNKTPDPEKAKLEYQALRSQDRAPYTLYAYKTEDYFIDRSNLKHQFTVLEYWYFYPFNDWKAKGGINNHEGDWETIMIFLDKDSQIPKYVAYSAHHNEGKINNPVYQYDSVRRSWNSEEVVKNENQIISFVALGSHANYPNNGNEGQHKTSLSDIISGIIGKDSTSKDGLHFFQESWQKISEFKRDYLPKWLIDYKGLWGVKNYFPGQTGPNSPYDTRFRHPVQWAGVDKIGQQTIYEQGIQIVQFITQGLKVIFNQALNLGTTIIADLHNEVISFGENADQIIFLPKFWDVQSTLENNTFQAKVELRYSQEELDFSGAEANKLEVFFYNPESQLWEKIASVLDLESKKIIFQTNHFSIYALGQAKAEDFQILGPEEIKIESQKKPYKTKEGLQSYKTALSSQLTEDIIGNLILVIKQTNLPHAEVVNADGLTQDGLPYFAFSSLDPFCKYNGDLEELFNFTLPPEIKAQMSQEKFNCTMVKKYPLLEEKMEHVLPPGKTTEKKEVRFKLSEKEAENFEWQGEVRKEL